MKILTDLLHDDLFPRERLVRMRSGTSQLETTHFIRSYRRRIYSGRTVPFHWHQYAADLLSDAAEAVFGDYEKFQGPLAETLGLQDRDNRLLRNDHICISAQQYLDQGMTLVRALEKVSSRLTKVEISLQPDSIRQGIWPKRNKEWTITMARELPDADFIAFLFLCAE